MPHPIYLDHNATTPVAPEVFDAMLPWLREHHGNPSSSHMFGQRAAKAVATARAQVASLIGAQPAEIGFHPWPIIREHPGKRGPILVRCHGIDIGLQRGFRARVHRRHAGHHARRCRRCNATVERGEPG